MPEIDYEELLEIRRVMAIDRKLSKARSARGVDKDGLRKSDRERIEDIKWKMAHRDDENYLIEIWDI